MKEVALDMTVTAKFSCVSHGFSCESDTDLDDSSCDIATNPVTQVPDLGKLTRTPWSQVTKS